jgi:site-specific DNA-methyltransferase (adenine-specific)
MKQENEIICGDALTELKKLPDESIDLILTDPPYNAKNIGPNKRKYSLGQMQLPKKEYQKFCKNWIREGLRISNRLVFTPGIGNMCYYPQPSWALCWHKPVAVSFNRFGGFNAWEPIFVYGKIAKGKRLGQDYLLFNTLNFTKGPEKEHPCPKPLELIKFLVDRFSNEREIILDPFCGSGTTCVAAKQLKRNFIGIEINPDYCEIARQRLRQEVLF